MKAAFYTLGCKVNQYETQIMEQAFSKAGFEIVDPARTVRGKAIDYDDLFAEVLGERADLIAHIDEKDVGGDYGSLEKDELEYSNDDGDGDDGDSDNMDFDEGGE